MSDFEELLNARTQEEIGAKLEPWTRSVLRKWRTQGLTEIEAWQLLGVYGQVSAPAQAIRQKRLNEMFGENGNPHGLLPAALFYGKDPRTIREWCKKGYFPGAYRSKGGHWRIPFKMVHRAEERLPDGFVRKPKTIFGTKVWKEFKADAQHIFGRILGQAFETEAAFQDMSEGEFALARKTKGSGLAPSEGTLDVLERASAYDKPLETGKTHALDYARLAALAHRLYLNNPEANLNYASLASGLKISVATLYRRFKAREIRTALNDVKQSSRRQREKDDHHENDHDVIVELTTKSELEWTDSPALRGKEDPE